MKTWGQVLIFNTNINIPNVALESFPTSGIVILHGPSGSGKTRLMQAAARYFSVQKGLDILHCCVLDLIQEMVEAIKEAAYTAFRASLMRRDALFIDNTDGLNLAVKDLKDNFEMYIERYLKWQKK